MDSIAEHHGSWGRPWFSYGGMGDIQVGDLQRAIDLAGSAGKKLLELRAQAGELGLEGHALKDAGDKVSQQYLDRALRELNPEDAILSEEALDDKRRLKSKRVWIIDPLDGTREYSEFRSDWAVHVALWENGSLVAGAVALPGLDLVLGSDDGQLDVAEINGRPIRIAVSRTRAPEVTNQLAQHTNVELVPMGSAGYKVCAVARGEVDAYIHAGGQFEWDSAAPVAVAAGKGLHTSRIDGRALEYNRDDPYLPDLLVCRADLKDTLLDAIREHS